ncbi:MAG: MarR family transcriptional regulator [Clostridiales bacterium]|nr:MarR family transcriptional regulator [Clostridiales bacterium]
MTVMNRERYRNERYENADTNDRIIINLRELWHKIRFRFERKGSQDRVLEILRERGEITQHELTERLDIKPGSSSELVAKLERAGMIRRNPNNNDRRIMKLSLTEIGMGQAEKSEGLREKNQEDMLSVLTQEEKEMLLNLLEKLNHSWKIQGYSSRRKTE